MRIAGVLLNALGVLATYYGGHIPYRTTDTLVQVGSLKATAEREHTVDMPWFVGPVLVAGGTTLLLVAGRRKRG